MKAQLYDARTLSPYFGPLPELSNIKAPRPGKLVREVLRAWDPVKQKMVWEHETSNGYRSYDGGVMTTAGNLVFQGRGDGEFWVYAADTGKVLKKIDTGSTIMAAPMTYSVNGNQYVAVQVGYGGTAIVSAISPQSAAFKYLNQNRIIAFKLDGEAVPKPPLRRNDVIPEPPQNNASKDAISAGELKFVQTCTQCHVFTPNITPNLLQMTTATHNAFKEIVFRGAREAFGMPRFDDILQEKDVDDIHAYLTNEQRKAFEQQNKK